MFELTPDNVADFLRGREWIGEGPVRVEALGWGVSNVVLRVETPEITLVVKQSRPQLRTRDPWFSTVNRVFREQEVMELLFPVLPEFTVPRVLHSDRDNYVFAMSAAPPELRVWKETLLAGSVEPRIGELAGKILGKIHECTALCPDLEQRFGDPTNFIQLRAEPFYERIEERCPAVSERVRRIRTGMLSVREALCHGDFSPKNILVHDRGVTLVDYETAYYGDPTMDLGFFLSHILLKAIRHRDLRWRFFELTEGFWAAYAKEIRFRPLPELGRRGIEHLGVCILARIDGTSPVDYLREEAERETARRLGRRLLQESPTVWAEVVDICDGELRNLARGTS